jgi:glycerol transport system ATP-binding protein
LEKSVGLSLQNIHKTVDNEIHLSNIDLDIEPGSKTVVLGRTLSGKTSLLRIMAGLDRPTQGALLLDGNNITGVPVRKRSIAMVYQHSSSIILPLQYLTTSHLL